MMAWLQDNTLRMYLEPTALCNFDHPIVRASAVEIVSGAGTAREAARMVFDHVRDAILFDATLDVWQKASQTIQGSVVDYCNKVNVHIALLRAAGVPARCHMARVENEVLKPFIPGFLYKRLPTPVGHFWCECYLEDRWVACEALFDRPLYRGMLAAGLMTRVLIPTLDWDGESDLILFGPWLVEDVGPVAHYDEMVQFAQDEGMPPKLFCKLFDWVPAYYSRRRTNRIRSLQAD